MRTKRSLVELPGGSQVELDEVRLPDGSMLLEAEVEQGDAEKHAAAVDELKKLVPEARASELSKFERFVNAMGEQGH